MPNVTFYILWRRKQRLSKVRNSLLLPLASGWAETGSEPVRPWRQGPCLTYYSKCNRSRLPRLFEPHIETYNIISIWWERDCDPQDIWAFLKQECLLFSGRTGSQESWSKTTPCLSFCPNRFQYLESEHSGRGVEHGRMLWEVENIRWGG